MTESSAISSITGLSSGVGIMSTAVATSEEERRATLTAILNAVPLNEHLGEQLDVVNIVAQAISIEDAATEEPRTVVRTIIITADNKAYFTTSDAIVAYFRDIFAVLGQPSDWKNPLSIFITQEKGSKAGRKFFKVSLV